MRGSVYKQCATKGCRSSPKCDHPWWLTFSHNGHRYRTSADKFAKSPVLTRTEAEKKWLPRFATAVMEGHWPDSALVPAPGAVLTVKQFLASYRTLHCEAQALHMKTLESRLDNIEKRFGDLQLAHLQAPEHIELFKLEMLRKGRTNATINRYLAQLKHMIGWAIGRGLLSKSPFHHKTLNPSGVRLLKGETQRRRRLKDGEEQALLAAADTMNTAKHDFVGPLMRGRIEAAIDLGLRRGEMLKVQNRDVDWQAAPDPVLTIRWGNAKSRKERQVPITSQRVRRFLNGRRILGPDRYPFGTAAGERIESLKQAWSTVLALASITDPSRELDGDLRWHDLRHECGSRFADRGLDGRHIQMLLGHADLKMTEKYLNSDVKALASAMRRAQNQ